MSSWTDRFSSALDALKDASGAAFDWSSNPYDSDKNVFADITDRLGRVVGGLTNAAGAASAGVIEPVLEGAGWLAENLVSEPLSTAVTAGSLADSSTWQQRSGTNELTSIFSPDTWSMAHGIAQKRSFGQAIALAFGTKDILAEQDKVKELDDSLLFHAVSGTIDGATAWFLDPLIFAGKGVSGVNRVRKGFNVGLKDGDKGWTAFWANAGVGPGLQSADDIASSKAVDEFLRWKTDKSGQQIYNHPAVRNSAYPSVMAGLLQEADETTSRLIIAAGYGSDMAYKALSTRRDDLAFRIARADNIINTAMDFELVRGNQFKTFMPKLAPSTKLAQPEPEQLPLFDIGAFPKGTEGLGGKTGTPKGRTPANVDDLRGKPGGPAGQPYDYPAVSGNVPKTAEGRYLIAPKSGAQATGLGGLSVAAGPYMMSGPINPEAVKELVPYLNGKTAERTLKDSVQESIPGLPAESQWKAARSWEQNDKTLEALGKGFDEGSSMAVKSWPEQNQKWFLDYQQEIIRKASPELDLLTAAIGPGGSNPGRGIWASMQDYAIRNSKDLAKADRAKAYDWHSKSLATEAVIHPKAFGLPVRVIKDMPLGIMRSFSEKRAPSWIDFNRGDSHAGFAAWLNHVPVFSPASKDEYIRAFMRAFTPEEKRVVVAQAEEKAIEFLGEKYGLSEQARKALAAESVGQRNKLISKMTEKRENFYASPAVQDRFAVDDDLIPVTSPLFETQITNNMPLLDLEKYDRVFRANAENLGAFDRNKASVADFLDRAHDVFSQVWSFSVLMRLGYTVRTVSDDMLRAMASLGAMSVMGGINAGLKSAFTKSGEHDQSWLKALSSGDATLTKGAAGQRAKNIKAKTKIAAVKLGSKAWATKAMEDGDMDELRQFVQSVTDKWGRDVGSVRIQNAAGFEYNGHRIAGPYEGRGDVYREIVGGSYEAIARTSKELIEQLRSDHAAWAVKNPTDVDHLDSWVYAANKQIAKSAIGQKFLEGMNASEVEQWLRRTPEGQAVRKTIGKNGRDPEQLAGMTQSVVDHYIPVLRDHDDPMLLRTLALEGKLDAKTLEQYFPDVATRPQVHGPTIDWNLNQGSMRRRMDSIVSNGFKWLSQIPTDRLVRHPTFRLMYQDNVKTLIDNAKLTKGAITGDELKAFEHLSREKSLKQINGLLYSLANKSDAAHTARFMTGFFSAWEDSIKRWAQLATDKPQLLFYGSKLWDAPNEMNLGSSQDEYGNRVPRIQVVDNLGRQVKRIDNNGRSMFATYDEKTGKWVEFDSNLNDATRIVGRLPEWFKKLIPGAEEFGSFELPKSSLNLILQGNPWWLPGAGPLIQAPISSLAASNPTSFASLYKWAIPFGQQSVADVMLPAWLKQAVKSGEGINDPSYAYMYAQIAQTEEMRVRQGLRERPSDAQFRQEVEDRTKAAFNIRSFTRFFLPFTADLQSPYQLFIDQYRQMRDAYGEEADERFYERYGDDLYVFTLALSKNNIGVAATDSAWKSVEKYKDLIASDPEYGALIVGPDAQKGAFNQYVHSAQFTQTLGAGSTVTARSKRSPWEALEDNNRRLGWTKFRSWMNQLDAIAVEQGLDENVLSKARGILAENLAKDNQAWGRDYYDSDIKAIPHRIDFFTTLVQNQQLLNQPMRTDLRTLNEYLKVRQQFVSVLQGLKEKQLPHSLDADANAGLAQQWAAIQHRFALSDTRFEDLFNRYLTNDRLQF